MNSELGQPIQPPPQDVDYLNLYIRLKQPAPVAAPIVCDEPEIPEASWQYLEGRWNAILGVEVSVDALR